MRKSIISIVLAAVLTIVALMVGQQAQAETTPVYGLSHRWCFFPGH